MERFKFERIKLTILLIFAFIISTSVALGEISEPQPVVSFIYEVDGTTVHFTDTSYYPTWSCYWDFGDGTYHHDSYTYGGDPIMNPVHTYPEIGFYTVSLSASNHFTFTSGTVTKTIFVGPLITWSNPADIVSGTPLSSIQLNAVAPIPGTFVYTPTEGTVLSAGTHTLHVDFTPSDSATYNNTSADVQINVLPVPLKNPTIIWDNPANITVGTALSSTQLNAVVKDPVSGDPVEGIFTYDPAAGTILSAGMGQKLHVNFKPMDTSKYSDASKDVTINVLERPVIPAPIINSIAVPLDPAQVCTSITASADVTYPGDLSTLTAEWNWGDGSTSKSQDSSSNFATSHVYNSPGIYTVNLKITDANSKSVTKEASNYIVVYDPQGGCVTGGGWINSPAGAYASDKTLAGKATFGFVSKYEKGANVPTGKTEFQFNAANLNFHSESYDWLVIAGSQAKYKGTGTINGQGNYGLILNAVDGTIKGDNIDRFRIKIWDKNNGNTIYDNEMGTGEDSEPSTAINGGSIIIHKKK